MAWLRDHLPLDAENLAVIHGDYHGGNLMFKNGSLSGVLDWSFCISGPAGPEIQKDQSRTPDKEPFLNIRLPP